MDSFGLVWFLAKNVQDDVACGILGLRDFYELVLLLVMCHQHCGKNVIQKTFILLGNSNLHNSHSIFFQVSVLQVSEVCLIVILLASQNWRHLTCMYFMVPEHLQGVMNGLSSSAFFAFSISRFFWLTWGVLLLSERHILHCLDVLSSSSFSPWSVNVCFSIWVDFLEMCMFTGFWTCLLSSMMSRTLNVIRPSLRKSFGYSWKPF